MTDEVSDDAAYAAAIGRDRALLLGVAFLLTGDLDRAEQTVRWTLDQAYPATTGRVALIALLVDGVRRGVRASDPGGARVDLIDSAPVEPGASIVADLRLLTPTDRAVLVLERYAELPTTQIAAVLGVPYDSVISAARRARLALVERSPGRSPDDAIAAELRAAVPDAEAVGSATADLDRARRKRGRRRLQRVAMAVAAVVVAILVTVQLVPERSTPQAGDPAASAPVPSAPADACSAAGAGCRTEQLARAWAVVKTHLDEDDAYFTHTSLVKGRDSVVTLRMSRPGGATSVLVEFAPDRRSARRCGEATGHRCMSQRFMDGNRFILTTSLTARDGIEVQYRPEGTEVFTAIARDSGPGERLEISTSDLIGLLEDPLLLAR